MKLFKFEPGSSPTTLQQGRAIEGATSILWVERYREPGEFQIDSLLSSGLREFLPEGTLISKTDTYDVMVVENHQISETRDEDPVLTITGRSLETVLENRISGINATVASTTLTDYTLAAAKTWAQAVTLINDHISTPTDPNDDLPNLVAATLLGAAAGVSEARTIPKEPVHKSLLDILAVEDLGIRVLRVNPAGFGSTTDTTFLIHRGSDVSASVGYSWKAGDLGSAEYLWSQKDLKTAALVVGRYVCRRVSTGEVNYDRRWMIVDGTDIDGNQTSVPVGGTLTNILNAMTARGNQALAAQNRINIVRSDISSQSQYRYRRDYNIGDIVAVNANFGEFGKLRVVEYVETWDQNGTTGYPTLAIPGETS